MELIKLVNQIKNKAGYWVPAGLFECPICGNRVVKQKFAGLAARTCSHSCRSGETAEIDMEALKLIDRCKEYYRTHKILMEALKNVQRSR